MRVGRGLLGRIAGAKRAAARRHEPVIESVVAANMVVDGSVRFSGSLRVEGTITGRVVSLGSGETSPPISDRSVLRIGPAGLVEGGASVGSIRVAGRLFGTVKVSGRLEILPGAIVDADILYRDLQIHHGATVRGSLAAIGSDGMLLRIVGIPRGE